MLEWLLEQALVWLQVCDYFVSVAIGIAVGISVIRRCSVQVGDPIHRSPLRPQRHNHLIQQASSVTAARIAALTHLSQAEPSFRTNASADIHARDAVPAQMRTTVSVILRERTKTARRRIWCAYAL